MHRNAPLTPEGRLRLCERIAAGWPVAHAAASMGISRDPRTCGGAGSKLKGSQGSRTVRADRATVRTRRRHRSSVASSGCGSRPGKGRRGSWDRWSACFDVHRVLVRHQLNRFDHLDRPTRRRSGGW